MRSKGGFTKEAWSDVEKAMKEKYGEEFDKDRLRNRLTTLKEKYSNVKDLLIFGSRFGWNDAAKMVTIEEAVWDDFIVVRISFFIYVIASFAYEWFRFMGHKSLPLNMQEHP
ncbi:hypothetical protein AMTR_s00054p00158190 [Amborella trichopoda]|uniref:Myb/SANT-like domain-containing protein n=1 Tax=Amborella trichopoda TaxID=13333 RepID=U5D9R6_AMBTC|nr:hypothetical protein AMTR_s00054p00158190 [Amborella trichopoda]